MSAKCTDCGRKIATSIRGTELCEDCLEYAGWENTHSDKSHQDAGAVKMGWATQDEIDECPVCHPELDPRKPRRAVTGTSRLGMTMVVPVRAAAEVKSEIIRKALAVNGFRGKVESVNGDATLGMSKGPKAAKISVTAHWDFAGRWTGGDVNGKKARNAKELLRLVAALTA